MEKVLLPVDGSPSSDHAVNEVIRHIKDCGLAMDIHLLNVQSAKPETTALDRRQAPPFEAGLAQLQSAREKLERARIPYRYHITLGPPAEAILEFCGEIQCTRIIMGSRNPRSAIRFQLDKVSVNVQRQAKVPVHVVPQGEMLSAMERIDRAPCTRIEPHYRPEASRPVETVPLELTAEGMRKVIQDIARLSDEPRPPTFPYRNDFLITYRIWSQLRGVHKLLLESATFQKARNQPETPASRQLVEFEQMLVTTIKATADIQAQILREHIASAEHYMQAIQQETAKFEQETPQQTGYW